MKNQNYYVYILASKIKGTLYIGVTNNLIRRMVEHKEKIIKGFSAKYDVCKLVYYETYNYVNDAIRREKALKEWHRKWKIRLIEKENKEWRDLFYDLVSGEEYKEMKELILIREKERTMDSGQEHSGMTE
ncbi:MAG: GIY-YIG nuclease family protein [Ignavibacteria bacterium]|jgi:putative endonuclease